ncbi:hypothetical protein [Microbispora sp. NPDC049125]|uniref:hypothetical protein n=1 Tax=Microbispora sp. NPDC049125 TaxID=3154929 RepID=UPI003465C92F
MDNEHIVRNAAHYASLSVNARLGAALRTLAAWLDGVKIRDTDLDDLMEHLWQWPTVTVENFDSWEASAPSLTSVGLGGEMPVGLIDKSNARSIPPEDLYNLICHTVEMVYDNIYGAVDNEATLDHLLQIELIALRYGLAVPSASFFADSPYDETGWGPRPGVEQLHQWRFADIRNG